MSWNGCPGPFNLISILPLIIAFTIMVIYIFGVGYYHQVCPKCKWNTYGWLIKKKKCPSCGASYVLDADEKSRTEE